MSNVSREVTVLLLGNKTWQSPATMYGTHADAGTRVYAPGEMWPVVCPGRSDLGPASGFPGTLWDDMEL